jgi:uncharacterized protein
MRRSVAEGHAASQHWGRRTAVALVRLYQLTLSPMLGPSCRFEPSCSEYAAQAISRHGVLRGLWMGGRRIGRCRPLGGQGFDPVP